MSDEKEYIERESIYSRVKRNTNPYGKPTLDYESGVKVLNMIEQEPAADVVEVVRCKDCKYVSDLGMAGLVCDHPDSRNPLGCRPDDFCNDGIRRDQT